MCEPKKWCVCDPYIASGSALRKWFDTEAEANAWLASQIQADEQCYVGCEVLPKDEALARYV